MTLQIDFWQLLGVIGALAAFIWGAIWAFARVIVGQFNANLEDRFKAMNDLRTQANEALEGRFDALRETLEGRHAENKGHWDDKFRAVESLSRANEMEVLKLRAELPNDYVRREDWIRFSGTIDSKLDSLRTLLDSVREKISARG